MDAASNVETVQDYTDMEDNVIKLAIRIAVLGVMLCGSQATACDSYLSVESMTHGKGVYRYTVRMVEPLHTDSDIASFNRCLNELPGPHKTVLIRDMWDQDFGYETEFPIPLGDEADPWESSYEYDQDLD
jgi:hypothetical protein